MISVTTEALEKTDEEVQTKDTAPVSAKPVDEEVQTKDTAPVSTPPSSSDEEIKVVSQEQKKEVTPLQTPTEHHVEHHGNVFLLPQMGSY